MLSRCLAVLIVTVIPGVASAEQDVVTELGGGVGFARALHGDLDFGGGAVSGTGRVRVTRRVAFEGQFGYWQHRRPERFVTPSRDVVQIRRTHRFPNVTASVVAVSDRDVRVGPYGGAGLGIFYHIAQYEQSATSRVPALAYSDWRVAVGATLVGGADVRLSPRVKAFGELRFDVQSFRDPGSSSYRVLGGVRLAIG